MKVFFFYIRVTHSLTSIHCVTYNLIFSFYLGAPLQFKSRHWAKSTRRKLHLLRLPTEKALNRFGYYSPSSSSFHMKVTLLRSIQWTIESAAGEAPEQNALCWKILPKHIHLRFSPIQTIQEKKKHSVTIAVIMMAMETIKPLLVASAKLKAIYSNFVINTTVFRPLRFKAPFGASLTQASSFT